MITDSDVYKYALACLNNNPDDVVMWHIMNDYRNRLMINALPKNEKDLIRALEKAFKLPFIATVKKHTNTRKESTMLKAFCFYASGSPLNYSIRKIGVTVERTDGAVIYARDKYSELLYSNDSYITQFDNMIKKHFAKKNDTGKLFLKDCHNDNITP